MNRNQKIAVAKKLAKENNAIFVDALYRTLTTIDHVLIKVPSVNDRYLKHFESHRIMVPESEELDQFSIVAVESDKDHGYFRRGDFVGEKMVTRNFFIDPQFLGKKMIAKVEIIVKIDLFRSSEKTMILNICEEKVNGTAVRPNYQLKLGVTAKKDIAEQFSIPGTDKVVRFEKI